MLDAGFIVKDTKTVIENNVNRGVIVDVDRVRALIVEWKTLSQTIDALKHQRNQKEKLALACHSKSAKAGKFTEWLESRDPEVIPWLNGEGVLTDESRTVGEELRQLKSKIEVLEPLQKQLDSQWNIAIRAIPNLTHPEAPKGTENRVIKKSGEPRKFDFTAKDHVALAEDLDLVDFESGSKVAGQKFYYLKNDAVLLECALIQYALGVLIKEGYTPIITPDVARNEVLEGIGFIPRGPETQIYSLENTNLSLVATAEITLGGIHRDQTLDDLDLPIKYAGVSHCFRTEAGAPGRDTRGLYRVHQFTKVEMFAFSGSKQDEDGIYESEPIHKEMLRIEESIFQGLGLPYQVIDTCTGDLGGPAYRKFDIEAWMPGRGQGGEYGEVTSTSNCTDYQARRLNIRYKIPGQKGTRFVHTLNGTAVAVSRAILAILENYQQADGTVLIPQVLQPVVGKDRITKR